MLTRIVFLVIVLLIITAGVWAYHHDQRLQQNAAIINVGDPNETVREVLGDPSSEGSCGTLRAVPRSCANEYVYRYWFSIFRPQYEVVWFDSSGKVLGEQHVQRP